MLKRQSRLLCRRIPGEKENSGLLACVKQQIVEVCYGYKQLDDMLLYNKHSNYVFFEYLIVISFLKTRELIFKKPVK